MNTFNQGRSSSEGMNVAHTLTATFEKHIDNTKKMYLSMCDYYITSHLRVKGSLSQPLKIRI